MQCYIGIVPIMAASLCVHQTTDHRPCILAEAKVAFMHERQVNHPLYECCRVAVVSHDHRLCTIIFNRRYN